MCLVILFKGRTWSTERWTQKRIEKSAKKKVIFSSEESMISSLISPFVVACLIASADVKNHCLFLCPLRMFHMNFRLPLHIICIVLTTSASLLFSAYFSLSRFLFFYLFVLVAPFYICLLAVLHLFRISLSHISPVPLSRSPLLIQGVSEHRPGGA